MAVNFTVQWLDGRAKDQSSQSLVNCYAQIAPKGSKTGYTLIGTPGTSTFIDLTSFGSSFTCRGLYTTSTDRLFGVYGNKLIEVTLSGGSYVSNDRLTISQGSNRVSMTDNGKYLIIVNGATIYAYNLDTDAQATVTYSITNPSFCIYQNGRVVVTNDSNEFFWSDLGDEGALNFDALSFATAESSADKINAIAQRQGDMWLFGPRSFEVWRNGTNADLPYNKVGGSSSEIGCNAKFSVAQIADQVFWLGSSNAGNNQIFMSNGYSAKKISNSAIEYQLNKMQTDGKSTSDAVGFAYQQEGHVFYVITFITGDKTFVFDVTTGLWHERTTREQFTNIQHLWRPLFATYAFNNVIVGNADGAYMLTLSLDKYDEFDSRTIVREVVSPLYWNDYKSLIVNEFQLDLAAGMSLQTGQGSDARVMLQYSDDGGFTWSSEQWVSMGLIGQYKARCRWHRLGRSYERTFKIRMSDPVKFYVLGANIIAQKGNY
jgi:hypothetical protein